MNPTTAGFCPVCKGNADIDLKLGTVKCRHCGSVTPVDTEMLEGLRAHLQQLDEQQAGLSNAASERDLSERTAARFKMPWVVRAGLAIAAFLWFGVALFACVAVIFALLPVWEQALGTPEGGMAASFLGIAVYAAMMWVPNLLTVRRRETESVLRIETDLRQTCQGCGAAVPLDIGAVTVCPFCNSNLIPTENNRAQVQREVRATVAREKQRGNAAAATAQKTGAQTVQDLLRIPRMISLPIIFVGPPYALGQLTARLAFRHIIPPDLFSRNQTELICAIAGGVFMVVTIATAIAIALRMDKPKKHPAGSAL